MCRFRAAARWTETYSHNQGGCIRVKNQTYLVAQSTCKEQALREIIAYSEDGFISAKVKEIYIYSCCTPPSATFGEYKQVLYALFLNERKRLVNIIAADLNT